MLQGITIQMKLSKSVLNLFVLFSALLTSACGPLIHLSATEHDQAIALANGQQFLDTFETEFNSGQYELEPDTVSLTEQFSPRTEYFVAHIGGTYPSEKPIVNQTLRSCLRLNKLWPNKNLDVYSQSDGLIRALEERYGILYQQQGEFNFYFQYGSEPRMSTTSRRQFVVGDGTQIFEIFQQTQEPRSGCALVNMTWPKAQLKQYARLYSLKGKPDLERLRAPVTDTATYLNAVKLVDVKYAWAEQSLADAHAKHGTAREARNAAVERSNREQAQRSSEHFANTYNRVMSETAATAQNHLQTQQRYQREANNAYQRNKWASNGGGSSSADDQASAKAEQSRQSESRDTALAKYALDKSQEKHAAKANKQSVKGTKYTKVSLEAHGTTNMHFAYEQALDLAETNAYNTAASSCAAQHGRLEKGSGTMAKKNCKENASGEYRCEVNMLFTCNKK